MRIVIAGDLVPTESNYHLFCEKNFIDNIDRNFVDVWNKADFRIFNLECPLGERLSPSIKNGPSLIAPSDTINGIKSLNPNLILLSNNHIKDYGISGVENTIELLNREKIPYTGVVNNSIDEYAPFYINKDGLKVCVYNVCENEFSVATNDELGANSLNMAKNCREIENAKQKSDYLIVVFHGGKEHYRYPSPNLQRICRNFVDFGADIVICQHGHCVGCKEEYNDSTIIYGQGNFIFDRMDNEYWNTSLLVCVDINKRDKNIISYYPIERDNSLIKLSNNSNILSDFDKRSMYIKDYKSLESRYNSFADDSLNFYLSILNKRRFYKRILNWIFHKNYFNKTYNKNDCLKILNIIECEAHRELLIAGLKNKIKKDSSVDK